MMYNEDILIGILLAKARPNIRITTDERLKNGYSIVPEIHIGGTKVFLECISVSLIHSKMRNSIRS